MFKPFYVHINPHIPGKMKSKHPRGATLLVSPVPEALQVEHPSCVVQGTWCSPKDAFCKKTGRENAAKGDKVIVNMRHLPSMVGKMEAICYGYTGRNPWVSSYDHLLRNFL